LIRCNGSAVTRAPFTNTRSRQVGAERRRLSTSAKPRIESRRLRVAAYPTSTRITVWGYCVGISNRVYKAAAPADQYLFLSRLSGRSKPQGALWAFAAYRAPILALVQSTVATVPGRVHPTTSSIPSSHRRSGPGYGRSRTQSVVTDVQNCPAHILEDLIAVLTAPGHPPFPWLPDDSRFHGSWNE